MQLAKVDNFDVLANWLFFNLKISLFKMPFLSNPFSIPKFSTPNFSKSTFQNLIFSTTLTLKGLPVHSSHLRHHLLPNQHSSFLKNCWRNCWRLNRRCLSSLVYALNFVNLNSVQNSRDQRLPCLITPKASLKLLLSILLVTFAGKFSPPIICLLLSMQFNFFFLFFCIFTVDDKIEIRKIFVVCVTLIIEG